MGEMNKTLKKLKKILIELFENDEDVPSGYNSRCVELNWFSSGVKNNVVAYIYKEMFGEPIVEDDFSLMPSNCVIPTIVEDDDGKRKIVPHG